MQPFVSAEEERSAGQDRAADRVAELVARERGLVGVEIVLGVEPVVAVELEHRAVERVGARLRRGIDDAARVVAVLRTEAVRQDLELANGLDAEDVARRAARLTELIVEFVPSSVKRLAV